MADAVMTVGRPATAVLSTVALERGSAVSHLLRSCGDAPPDGCARGGGQWAETHGPPRPARTLAKFAVMLLDFPEQAGYAVAGPDGLC